MHECENLNEMLAFQFCVLIWVMGLKKPHETPKLKVKDVYASDASN